jgi:hypothetical protein
MRPSAAVASCVSAALASSARAVGGGLCAQRQVTSKCTRSLSMLPSGLVCDRLPVLRCVFQPLCALAISSCILHVTCTVAESP